MLPSMAANLNGRNQKMMAVLLLTIMKLKNLTLSQGNGFPCGRSTEPEANISGLQEGKPYKFRVKAVNKEGESEPLEAEKSIIAKNPFGKYLYSNCCSIH